MIPLLIIGQTLTGTVFEWDSNQKKTPLPGVGVYWDGLQQGVTTDEKGQFVIKKPEDGNHALVFSHVAYKSDTLIISYEQTYAEVILSSREQLNEVEVTDRKAATFKPRSATLQTQVLTGSELCRAACCNLSESFETNASVDISYADALTGSKRIQLLGLTGTYIQMMMENIPNFRGLAAPYGMTYIPGSWMESIQLSKGTGSVVNGYESLTGQINVEYKKPDANEMLFVNVFGSDMGMMEGNINASYKLNEKWSTMIFAHGQNQPMEHDGNDDSFLDEPILKQYNFLNRWKYNNPNRFIMQFGMKILDETRTGGQKNFDKNKPRDTTNGYGINISTLRYESFFKAGYIFPHDTVSSIAIIANLSSHEHLSFYGLTNYNALQNSLYTNLIFQSNLGSNKHSYSTGISSVYDDYDEKLNDSLIKTGESLTGIYLQYTFRHLNILSVQGGLRADHNSLYGNFITPRLHVKYDVNENTILRASAGKGYRSPHVIAENSYLMASSRKPVFLENLKQEEAWNFGINITRYILLNKRNMTVSTEFYHTRFINHPIIDIYSDISVIRFYNLQGRSFANSVQAEITYEPVKRLSLTTAFRYSDVKTTIHNRLIEKPLTNRYKGLITLSYYTNLKKWQFDFTSQFNGPGTLPDTRSYPESYRRDEEFPSYTIINAQITKFFKKWSIYAGADNIFNFVQKNPIIGYDRPFGNNFDASMIWGPIHGRKIYAGIRYSLERS